LLHFVAIGMLRTSLIGLGLKKKPHQAHIRVSSVSSLFSRVGRCDVIPTMGRVNPVIGHVGIGQFVVRLAGGGNAELPEGGTSILVFALIGSKSLRVSRWCLGNMFVKDHTASSLLLLGRYPIHVVTIMGKCRSI